MGTCPRIGRKGKELVLQRLEGKYRDNSIPHKSKNKSIQVYIKHTDDTIPTYKHTHTTYKGT